MNDTQLKHYCHAHHLTWDRAADRVVVLDAEGSTMLTLNPVGSILWTELREPRSADALVQRLQGEFPEVADGTLCADVDAFIEELTAEGLLVTVPDE